MVITQNECENYVRILEEEKYRSSVCSLCCEKSEKNVILIAIPKREKPKTVRTSENIAAVAESMCEALSTSINRHSQQSNIWETSLERILHKDFGMTPYKVQLVQVLKPVRYRFAKWASDQLTEDADFGKKKKNHHFR